MDTNIEGDWIVCLGPRIDEQFEQCSNKKKTNDDQSASHLASDFDSFINPTDKGFVLSQDLFDPKPCASQVCLFHNVEFNKNNTPSDSLPENLICKNDLILKECIGKKIYENGLVKEMKTSLDRKSKCILSMATDSADETISIEDLQKFPNCDLLLKKLRNKYPGSFCDLSRISIVGDCVFTSHQNKPKNIRDINFVQKLKSINESVNVCQVDFTEIELSNAPTEEFKNLEELANSLSDYSMIVNGENCRKVTKNKTPKSLAFKHNTTNKYNIFGADSCLIKKTIQNENLLNEPEYDFKDCLKIVNKIENDLAKFSPEVVKEILSDGIAGFTHENSAQCDPSTRNDAEQNKKRMKTATLVNNLETGEPSRNVKTQLRMDKREKVAVTKKIQGQNNFETITKKSDLNSNNLIADSQLSTTNKIDEVLSPTIHLFVDENTSKPENSKTKVTSEKSQEGVSVKEHVEPDISTIPNDDINGLKFTTVDLNKRIGGNDISDASITENEETTNKGIIFINNLETEEQSPNYKTQLRVDNHEKVAVTEKIQGQNNFETITKKSDLNSNDLIADSQLSTTNKIGEFSSPKIQLIVDENTSKPENCNATVTSEKCHEGVSVREHVEPDISIIPNDDNNGLKSATVELKKRINGNDISDVSNVENEKTTKKATAFVNNSETGKHIHNQHDFVNENTLASINKIITKNNVQSDMISTNFNNLNGHIVQINNSLLEKNQSCSKLNNYTVKLNEEQPFENEPVIEKVDPFIQDSKTLRRNKVQIDMISTSLNKLKKNNLSTDNNFQDLSSLSNQMQLDDNITELKSCKSTIIDEKSPEKVETAENCRPITSKITNKTIYDKSGEIDPLLINSENKNGFENNVFDSNLILSEQITMKENLENNLNNIENVEKQQDENPKNTPSFMEINDDVYNTFKNDFLKVVKQNRNELLNLNTSMDVEEKDFEENTSEKKNKNDIFYANDKTPEDTTNYQNSMSLSEESNVELTDDNTTSLYRLNDSSNEDVCKIMLSIVKDSKAYFRFNSICNYSNELMLELNNAGLKIPIQDHEIVLNVQLFLNFIGIYIKWFESEYIQTDKDYDTVSVTILSNMIIYMERHDGPSGNFKKKIENCINNSLKALHKYRTLANKNVISNVSSFEHLFEYDFKNNAIDNDSNTNNVCLSSAEHGSNSGSNTIGIIKSLQSKPLNKFNSTEILGTNDFCLPSVSVELEKDADVLNDVSIVSQCTTDHSINNDVVELGMTNEDKMDIDVLLENDGGSLNFDDCDFPNEAIASIIIFSDNECNTMDFEDYDYDEILKENICQDSPLVVNASNEDSSNVDEKIDINFENMKTREGSSLMSVCEQLVQSAKKDEDMNIDDIDPDITFNGEKSTDNLSNGYFNVDDMLVLV